MAGTMALTYKGGRYMTRGWKGSSYVKRQTAKKARRLSREAIRANEGEGTKALTRGWVW